MKWRDSGGAEFRGTNPAGDIVVGLTGPNAAGKGEVARILQRLGFRYHSLSDIVREEAVARGRTTGRDDLILTGNDLRREGGPGTLAERILPRLGGLDLVDSIRNPGEVEVLRGGLNHFYLLGVTAPPEVRFARALGRKGRGDSLGSLEAFLSKEREENSEEETAQRLDATLALADAILVNAGDLDVLDKSVREWVSSLDLP